MYNKKLPYDVSRCSNKNCKINQRCARFTDIPPDGIRYSIAEFKPIGILGRGWCTYYINNK